MSVEDFSTIRRADEMLGNLAKATTKLGETGPDTIYGMVSFHIHPDTGETLLFVDDRHIEDFPPSMRVRVAQSIFGDIFFTPKDHPAGGYEF